MPTEPRLRILIAEVQSRCGSLFAAADATPHEERMTRQTARLTLRLAETLRTSATQDRLLQALADPSPRESPENWADRAGLLWCAEPEVTAARVVWTQDVRDVRPVGRRTLAWRFRSQTSAGTSEAAERPPSLVLPLRVRGRAAAEIHLWCDRQPDPT